MRFAVLVIAILLGMLLAGAAMSARADVAEAHPIKRCQTNALSHVHHSKVHGYYRATTYFEGKAFGYHHYRYVERDGWLGQGYVIRSYSFRQWCGL